METVNCPKCGEENPRKSRACAKCGTLLHLMVCPKCGATNLAKRWECHECGAELHEGKALTVAQQNAPAPITSSALQEVSSEMLEPAYVERQLVNTSGYGFRFSLPEDVGGWNWGAFWLTWIWGMANNVWVAFAAFLPGACLIVPFILGARGSEWAWQHRRYERGTAEFRAAQRKWAIWGWIFGIPMTALTIWALVVMPPKIIGAYHNYKKTVADIQKQVNEATKEFSPGGKGELEKQLKDLLGNQE